MAERSFLKRDPFSAERLGARFGNLAYKLDKKHRQRTLSNLEMAMPELSQERREEIALGVFRHFGRITADFMRAEVRTEKDLLDSLDIHGYENLEAANAAGKGVLIVTGHYGNWERLAHWLALQGNPFSVVARDANDTGMNLKVNQKRHASGVEVISRGNAARIILTKLKQKELVGIIPDQNSGESYLPFFNKPCGTVLGPAVLHLRTKAPILPVFCHWVAPCKYKVEILPPVVALEGEKPEDIMTRINAILEGNIREHPEQWLWMHDRWKSARQKGLL